MFIKWNRTEYRSVVPEFNISKLNTEYSKILKSLFDYVNDMFMTMIDNEKYETNNQIQHVACKIGV